MNLLVSTKLAFLSLVISSLFVSTCYGEGSQGGNLGDIIHKVFSNCSKELHDKCYGLPENCFKNKHDGCKILVAVDKVVKNKQVKYRFQLIGTGFYNTQATGGYVAIGFSENGKDMNKASIVTCKRDESGRNSIQTMWSDKAESPKETNPSPSYIGDAYMALEETEGKIYCTFVRDAKSSDNGHEFHLDEKKYDILVAKGELKQTPGDEGKIKYHKAEDRQLLVGAWNSANGPKALALLPIIALLSITKIIF